MKKNTRKWFAHQLDRDEKTITNWKKKGFISNYSIEEVNRLKENAEYLFTEGGYMKMEKQLQKQEIVDFLKRHVAYLFENDFKKQFEDAIQSFSKIVYGKRGKLDGQTLISVIHLEDEFDDEENIIIKMFIESKCDIGDNKKVGLCHILHFFYDKEGNYLGSNWIVYADGVSNSVKLDKLFEKIKEKENENEWRYLKLLHSLGFAEIGICFPGFNISTTQNTRINYSVDSSYIVAISFIATELAFIINEEIYDFSDLYGWLESYYQYFQLLDNDLDMPWFNMNEYRQLDTFGKLSFLQFSDKLEEYDIYSSIMPKVELGEGFHLVFVPTEENLCPCCGKLRSLVNYRCILNSSKYGLSFYVDDIVINGEDLEIPDFNFINRILEKQKKIIETILCYLNTLLYTEVIDEVENLFKKYDINNLEYIIQEIKVVECLNINIDEREIFIYPDEENSYFQFYSYDTNTEECISVFGTKAINNLDKIVTTLDAIDEFFESDEE